MSLHGAAGRWVFVVKWALISHPAQGASKCHRVKGLKTDSRQVSASQREAGVTTGEGGRRDASDSQAGARYGGFTHGQASCCLELPWYFACF